MFNPTYLQRSRHGIYYFRWTLPPCKQTGRRASSIKLSLRTRETRLALQLAMPLSCLARSITEHGLNRRMDFKQLRTVLTDHFSRFLAARKAQIDEAGPLSESNRLLMETTAAIAEMELADGEISSDNSNRTALAFIEQHGLDVHTDGPLFETFKRSIAQAQRDYAKAVLAYSTDAESFNFSPLPSRKGTLLTTSNDSLSLSELVEKFWKYSKLENRWTAKTESEKLDHIDLLYERLGKNISAKEMDREKAHLMRDTLVAYPANRSKNKMTRGKPLLEILDIPNVAKLHQLTVNKYLQTYSGLFNWAVQNGHCASNPFEGLALRTNRSNREAPRLPFTDDQLKSIMEAVLKKTDPKDGHHKWGTLIAIHSGARLNEIAQLHIADIRQIDDIWCLDINQKAGTLKKLKNAASKRIVPIHPQVIG